MGDLSALRSSTTPVVELRAVSKQFGGVYALRDASLAVLPGEIHGLVGQNGSGKSTLIKILSGYHAPEPGAELFVSGASVTLPLRPGHARDLGISFVHQDLGLVESRSVLDNLRIDSFRTTRWGHISWPEERRLARAMLARFDLKFDLDGRVAALKDVDRALLAIVRAVQEIERPQDVAAGRRAGLLVLDEPTVYLPRDSVDALFHAMRDVAASGQGLLFVSHQLGEVKKITDCVSVLRDGRLVGHAQTAETSEHQLIEMILGRRLEDLYPAHIATVREGSVLSVRSLSGGSADDVSFDLRSGEILGLTGLVGAGFDDVPYLIYGAQRARVGHLTLAGRSFIASSATPDNSIRQRMVLVPANRLRDGIAPRRSVADNVAVPMLARYFRRGRLRLGSLHSGVTAVLQACDVRPADPQRQMATLSGGNQQKAVLGKWLQTKPSVLLMHEPTQGVDIGARKQIFSLIREAAGEGAGVVIASAEHEDLAHVCNRVLVFRGGRVASELSGAALTSDRLLDESYRTSAAGAAST